jgi:hypothetical protein
MRKPAGRRPPCSDVVPSERVRLNGGHARLRTISRSDVLDPSRRTCPTRPPPERRSPEAQAPRALTTVWATVALPRHDLGSRVSLRRAPWPRAASARRLASAARRRRTAGPLPPAASAGPRRREGKASLHSGDAGAGHDRRWLAFLHLAERGDRDAKILDPVRQVATQPLGDALGQGSSTPSGRSSCRRRWWPAGRPPTVRAAGGPVPPQFWAITWTTTPAAARRAQATSPERTRGWGRCRTTGVRRRPWRCLREARRSTPGEAARRPPSTSRGGWRAGATSAPSRPRRRLQDAPVCGTCASPAGVGV